MFTIFPCSFWDIQFWDLPCVAFNIVTTVYIISIYKPWIGACTHTENELHAEI